MPLKANLIIGTARATLGWVINTVFYFSELSNKEGMPGMTIGAQLDDINQRIEALEAEMNTSKFRGLPERSKAPSKRLLESLNHMALVVKNGYLVMPSSELQDDWVLGELTGGYLVLESHDLSLSDDIPSINLDRSQTRTLRDYLNTLDLED